MIKSNQFKKNEELYPTEFTDEDKSQFDLLFEQAKVIHSEVFNTDPWIIRLAIIAHIRINKGMAEPYTNEELEDLKNKYTLKNREFITNSNDHPYLYDTVNNPIFKPDSYFYEEVNSNMVTTSNLELTNDKIILNTIN